MGAFDDHLQYTLGVLAQLRKELEKQLGDEDLKRLLKNEVCVYVVGSGGRGEMTASGE